MPVRSSELRHKRQCLKGCSFCSHGHLEPQTVLSNVSLIPKLAHLKFAKSQIYSEKGSAQAPREIPSSSATQQISSFLKEDTPRESLRDQDHKSTDGLSDSLWLSTPTLWFPKNSPQGTDSSFSLP